MSRRFWLLMLMAALLWSTSVAQPVRVRLWSQHPPRELQLSASPSFNMRTCPSCAALGGHEHRIVAQADSVKINRTPYRRLLVSGGYLLTVDGHAVHLSAPLEIVAKGGVLLLTVQLPLEDYVAGVLAGEAEGMRSQEALKAMAVAARTYAVHFRGRHRLQGFDLCDSTHCQVLRLSTVNDRARAAAEATEGGCCGIAEPPRRPTITRIAAARRSGAAKSFPAGGRCLPTCRSRAIPFASARAKPAGRRRSENRIWPRPYRPPDFTRPVPCSALWWPVARHRSEC